MSITLPPVPENLDALGRFTIVTRTVNAETGEVVGVHRAPVAPGSWDDAGNWVPTVVADLPEGVQAFAQALWTDGAVARFKAALPWVPSPLVD